MTRLQDNLAALIGTDPSTTTTPDPVHVRHPRGWEPGVTYAPDGVMTVAAVSDVNVHQDHAAWRAMVEDLGLAIPEGWRVRLAEAKWDPVAWTRDTPQQKKAVTRPVWRYRFVVEPDPGTTHQEDVSTIIREVMRTRRRRPAPASAGVERGLVLVYADPQAGKVDDQGGTAALAARVRDCLDQVDDYLTDLRRVGRAPTEAAWVDAGDAIEGIDNTAQQAHTNDLTTTQQIRAHRRFTFHGLEFLAARFPNVTATTCGSNHAMVRRGKERIGPPDDDWGIEVLSQVQDAFARNAKAFGHVRFAYPPAWKDTVRVDVAGMPIAVAHGHQVPAGNVVRWWKDQTFGDQPVAGARILITGHYHHFRAQDVGNGQLWLQAPTLDNGSSWYAMRTGEVSQPGMLVLTVTKDGWDDLRILRPRTPGTL